MCVRDPVLAWLVVATDVKVIPKDKARLFITRCSTDQYLVYNKPNHWACLSDVAHYVHVHPKVEPMLRLWLRSFHKSQLACCPLCACLRLSQMVVIADSLYVLYLHRSCNQVKKLTRIYPNSVIATTKQSASLCYRQPAKCAISTRSIHYKQRGSQ